MKLSEAYLMGVRANVEGAHLSDNPFSVVRDYSCYQRWNNGWNDEEVKADKSGEAEFSVIIQKDDLGHDRVFRVAPPLVEPPSLAGGDPVTRGEFCDEAKKTICHDRNESYGEPENRFPVIAGGWTWYLRSIGKLAPNAEIDGADVAELMELFKIGRAVGRPFKADHYTDRIGYAAIAAELRGQGQAKKDDETA